MIIFGLMFLSGCSFDQAKDSTKLETIQKKNVLRVAVSPDFAPMEFIDANKSDQMQYVGFDIELAKYIASELGVELFIDAMDFSSCQAAVSLGNVDISISGYAETAERAKNFILSDPYYADDNNEQGILVLASNLDALEIGTDFDGKLVSAQNASLQYNLLIEQLPNAEANPIVDLNTAVLELINGKVDGLCVAIANGEAFIENYPSLALSPFRFEVENEGNVILIKKGETDLEEVINKILAKAYEQGLYTQWYSDAVALAKELGEITE